VRTTFDSFRRNDGAIYYNATAEDRRILCCTIRADHGKTRRVLAEKSPWSFTSSTRLPSSSVRSSGTGPATDLRCGGARPDWTLTVKTNGDDLHIPTTSLQLAYLRFRWCRPPVRVAHDNELISVRRTRAEFGRPLRNEMSAPIKISEVKWHNPIIIRFGIYGLTHEQTKPIIRDLIAKNWPDIFGEPSSVSTW
jgi:hypothetical protein